MKARPFRSPILLLPLLLLVGCGVARQPVEDQARLASACEVTKCRCVAEKTSVFRSPETESVRWRRDGTAFCPAGLHLERVVEERRPGY